VHRHIIHSDFIATCFISWYHKWKHHQSKSFSEPVKESRCSCKESGPFPVNTISRYNTI
jgi:hypothetical protein